MGAHIRILPPNRREEIEREIEIYLHRVEILIARLDRADAPFMDIEDDDPAGDKLDEGEMDEAERLPLPLYGLDQSKGPLPMRYLASTPEGRISC